MCVCFVEMLLSEEMCLLLTLGAPEGATEEALLAVEGLLGLFLSPFPFWMAANNDESILSKF